MTLTLYAHPFSSYCQKALIAFHENDVPFVDRRLDEPGAMAELERLWPLKRFPVLVDGERSVIEASIIIEYIGLRHPGAVVLIPPDPDAALEVRFLDRFFDNYIQGPMQAVVANALRPVDARDPYGVGKAEAALDTAYGWLDGHMAGRRWAAGEAFTLADCAAAPALFYADWVHPIGSAHANVRAYRERLNARPSFRRCIEDARPHRHLFPLGAPDRD